MVVVRAGANPSYDYYLAPRLARMTDARVDTIDLAASAPPVLERTPERTFLIFCRYLTPQWRRVAARAAPRLAGLGVLVDDDYASLLLERGAPARYRWKIARLGLAPLLRLRGAFTHVWTCGDTLARRLAPRFRAGARPVAPLASAVDLGAPAPARSGPTRLAFHATAAHRAEHEWLAGFAEALIAACPPGARLEVIADRRLAPIWAGRSGIDLRSPLDWPRYRARVAADGDGPDLLLAPLLDSRSNAARAPSKAIDASRMGAAAIFADGPAYASLAGVAPRLPPDPALWIAEAARLSSDAVARAGLRDALRAHVATQAETADPNDLFAPTTARRSEGQ